MNLTTTFPMSRAAIACATALALVVTACGGGSDDAADTTVAATEPATVETEPPATDPPATDPPATAPPATEPPPTDPPTTEAPPETNPPETTTPDEPEEPDEPADPGPEIKQEVARPEDSQLAFIFDASGSMNAELEGSTRLAVAKGAIDQLVGETATFNTSLWAYGHRLPDSDPETCRDIENLVVFAQDNGAAVVSAVAALEARGDTPITDAVRTVAGSFTAPETGRRSIVLISDGEETCGGDPCALGAELGAVQVDLRIHAIGFAVDDTARNQLSCLAEATGGTYADAGDAEALDAALADATDNTFGTTLRVEVSDPSANDDPVVQLIDPSTGDILPADPETGYDGAFFASETVVIPPGTWDVVVGTEPRTVLSALEFPEGSETVIPIGLGELAINLIEPDIDLERALAQLKSLGDEDAVAAAEFVEDSPFPLRSGSYEVRINSSPPFTTEVTVRVGEVTSIDIEFGAVSVATTIDAPQFQILDADGERISGGSVTLDETARVPPGDYIVQVRDERQPITVVAGEAQTVEI